MRFIHHNVRKRALRVPGLELRRKARHREALGCAKEEASTRLLEGFRDASLFRVAVVAAGAQVEPAVHALRVEFGALVLLGSLLCQFSDKSPESESLHAPESSCTIFRQITGKRIATRT